MVKIKICGLRRKEDIEFVNLLKPDFAGFIATKGFKRSVENANELLALLDKNIKSVGVFVNDDIEVINNSEFDFVQLHGNESVEYCSKITKPIIKVFKPNEFDKISEYENVAQYFLFDSGTGSGKVFDWNLLPKTKKPFILAGGLDENNLANAIDEIKPYAVDMSSSVETNGVKDFEKIKNVINIVRSRI